MRSPPLELEAQDSEGYRRVRLLADVPAREREAYFVALKRYRDAERRASRLLAKLSRLRGCVKRALAREKLRHAQLVAANRAAVFGPRKKSP